MSRTSVILIILIFIGQFTFIFQVFPLFTHGVTYMEFFLGLFYLYCLKRLVWNGEKIIITAQPAFIFILLLIASILISTLMPLLTGSNIKIFQTVKSSLLFGFIMFFVFFCTTSLIHISVWDKLIKAILIVSIIINIFAVYQIFARVYELPLAWLPVNNVSMTVHGVFEENELMQLSLRFGNFFRATSIFPEPSMLASFELNLIIFLAIPFFQGKKSFITSKLFIGICFSLMLVATFLTYSLTALLGIVFIVTTVFILERGKGIKILTIILISSALMIFIIDGLIEKYTEVSVAELFYKRVEAIFNVNNPTNLLVIGESAGGRWDSAIKSIKLWEINPFFGTGLGVTMYNGEIELVYSDSTIMQVLSETGILGTISFIGIFITLFVNSLKLRLRTAINLSNSHEEQRIAGIAIYLMIILIMFNFITANNLMNGQLWLYLGIVISIVSHFYNKSGKKVFELKFVRIPLKEYFRNRLRAYSHFIIDGKSKEPN